MSVTFTQFAEDGLLRCLQSGEGYYLGFAVESQLQLLKRDDLHAFLLSRFKLLRSRCFANEDETGLAADSTGDTSTETLHHLFGCLLAQIQTPASS